MLITGDYLLKYFKNKAGMPYTAYLDPTKWNRLFEEAFIQGVEERYRSEADQKIKDEISQFISTNVIIQNIGGNSINIQPIVITSLTNPSTTNWVLQTNIPFSPQNTVGVIDINGVTGFTTNPNGQFVVISFTKTVKGTTQINFTAPNGSSGAYAINSGTFSFQNTGNLVANQLIDYVHLLNIKCKFTKSIYQPTITSSTNGTPIVVSLNYYNNLRSSSLWNNVMVTMSGWINNTSANGSFYIKKINDLQFQLYSDIYLQNPVVGISNETAGNVTLGYTYYNSARPYLSVEKISTLNFPTEDNPRYEIASGRLNLYPTTTPCTEVTIDYICKPKLPYINSQQNDTYSGIYVDSNDTVFDLTTIYSEKLLFSTIDRMMLIFSGSSRDNDLGQISMEQLSNNP